MKIKDVTAESKIELTGFYHTHPSVPGHGIWHEIKIKVNAIEAVRTRYAYVINDEIIQFGEPGWLFFKLEPLVSVPYAFMRWTNDPSVIRWQYGEVPLFDHILTEEEATRIIENEMARYDEVLAKATELSRRNVLKTGEACKWCLRVLPNPTGKPSECQPNCPMKPKLDDLSSIMRPSEKCQTCEVGIIYGGGILPTCFNCAHVLKASSFSDRNQIRCPTCEHLFKPVCFEEEKSTSCPSCHAIFSVGGMDTPQKFFQKCPKCSEEFEVKTARLLISPTVFRPMKIMVT